MTDFVADLEAELLAAARRRAHPPAACLRLPLRPILVAATALAAALVARDPHPAPAPDERPATARRFRRARAGRAGPLRPARCGCRARRPSRPGSGLLARARRRMPRDGDRLPLAIAASRRARGCRRVTGGRHVDAARRVTRTRARARPTNDVRDAAARLRRRESRGPGACLVVAGAHTRESLASARCFTLAEIRDGRAFAVLDAGEAGARPSALVPDGIAEIELTSVRRRPSACRSTSAVQRKPRAACSARRSAWARPAAAVASRGSASSRRARSRHGCRAAARRDAGRRVQRARAERSSAAIRLGRAWRARLGGCTRRVNDCAAERDPVEHAGCGRGARPYAITYARMPPREWDASSYDRMSDPQLAMARDVIDRLDLQRRRARARRRLRHRPRHRGRSLERVPPGT